MAPEFPFDTAPFDSLGGQLPSDGGRRREREFLSLMMAPIREAYIRPAHFVPGTLDIVSVRYPAPG